MDFKPLNSLTISAKVKAQKAQFILRTKNIGTVIGHRLLPFHVQ